MPNQSCQVTSGRLFGQISVGKKKRREKYQNQKKKKRERDRKRDKNGNDIDSTRTSKIQDPPKICVYTRHWNDKCDTQPYIYIYNITARGLYITMVR